MRVWKGMCINAVGSILAEYNKGNYSKTCNIRRVQGSVGTEIPSAMSENSTWINSGIEKMLK